MTYKENVRAILECNFASFKDDVIDNATKKIMELHRPNCGAYMCEVTTEQIDNIKRIVRQAEGKDLEREMCAFSISEIAEEWLELEMNYAALIEVAKDWLKMKEGDVVKC